MRKKLGHLEGRMKKGPPMHLVEPRDAWREPWRGQGVALRTWARQFLCFDASPVAHFRTRPFPNAQRFVCFETPRNDRMSKCFGRSAGYLPIGIGGHLPIFRVALFLANAQYPAFQNHRNVGNRERRNGRWGGEAGRVGGGGGREGGEARKCEARDRENAGRGEIEG